MNDAFASLERRRTRSTPDERANWVHQYEQSGLSQREFASRQRLGLSTLCKWIAQNESRGWSGRKAHPVWQELKLDGLPRTPCWAAEVVRADSWVVRVSHDAPASLVAQLLQVRLC
jgi:transposase-like protein